MRDRSFFFNSRSRARALKARFSEAHAREKISEGMREERDGASSRRACFSFSLSLHAFFRMGDTRRIHFFSDRSFRRQSRCGRRRKFLKTLSSSFSRQHSTQRARALRGEKNTSRMTNANRTVISIVCLVHLQLTFINLFSFLLHL